MHAWTMSSETSTESQFSGDFPSQRSDSLQPWQLFTLAGLIGASITVFLSRGQSPAAVILLSLTVFAAAAVGIAALRMVIPLTSKARPDSTQVLGGRTRAVLERDKALVLRSIKELEFDRAMGKISDQDFAVLSGRLRARALALMESIQQSATGSSGSTASAVLQKSQGPRASAICAACETANDPDARFCKHCGAKL